MASESESVEQTETFSDTKPRENKIEESGSLKRSFEGNSDYQPETKKIAMSENSSNNGEDTRPTPMPALSPTQVPISSPHGQTIENIKVPDRMVGLLIGKGGEQISSIQNECQCRIQFAPSKPGSTERECSISGPTANVTKARKVIDDIVFKNQLVLLGGDEGYIDMYIPGNKVGLIIGKNGDTIKQLQEKSGVKVAVIQSSTEPSQFEKPLRITGNKAGVQKAREMVLEILNEHDRIGGLSSRASYGGPSGGNKINLQIPVPRNLVGIVIGKGGEMIKKIQEDSGAKVQFKSDDIADDGPDRICHVYGYKQNTDAANQMIHELIKQGMHRINGGVSMGFRSGPTPFANGTVHSIPADKCGLVIGKGGENIKEINRASGAHAELIRENNNDPNVKRFRIQGTPDQIQSCIQLINEKAGLPPVMGGPVYGGLQGPGVPSMIAQFPTLNMPGPAGSMVTSFPGQTQVVLPNATVYGAQVQQTQWANTASATAYQQATPAQFNQAQAAATVVVDPTKANDQNATAWAAYYAQLYGSSAGVQGQVGGSSAVAAVPQAGMQAMPGGPVVNPGGGHPGVAYATQVIPAPAAQTAGQPQPTINPITGQHDYSLAWAEYYRAQGLHQQAAAIMQGAGMPAPQ